jgi:hypothetical protein
LQRSWKAPQRQILDKGSVKISSCFQRRLQTVAKHFQIIVLAQSGDIKGLRAKKFGYAFLGPAGRLRVSREADGARPS